MICLGAGSAAQLVQAWVTGKRITGKNTSILWVSLMKIGLIEELAVQMSCNIMVIIHNALCF